jgi:urea transport system substrate-binding protein
MSDNSPAAGPSPPGEAEKADPRVGSTYGKYRIIRLLGQGGMGTVYEGVDEGLKRNVAVKFLPDEVLKKPDVIERFMREAQVAGRLSHPNIIAIYDVGHDERGCYMVMELLHPASASNRIKKKGPYPFYVATRIIADCCAALKVAHEAGIVHRDIKPDNILFSLSGVVKLVDFGLVKLMEDDLHLTQSGMLCGTPMYMSPEQASNKAMDPRSDLYSLGATYYALLTGRAPFSGDGVPQILLSHLKDPTPDPRELVPEIPESCVQVLMHAMEKDREVRYQTAAEMAADLETILAGIPQRNASIFEMEESSSAIAAQPPRASGGNPVLSGRSAALRPKSGGQSAVQRGSAIDDAGGISRRGFIVFTGLGMAGLVGGGVYFWKKERAANKRTGSTPGELEAKGPALIKSGPPLKVGVLHSLTGSLAVSEHPLADASLLAIEELNAKGGVLSREVQPIVLDGKSEVTADSAYVKSAERLLEKEKVSAVFGGYGSASRKLIVPLFEKYDQLLFYPAPYEGLEESQNVIYTGATPNQLAIPALHYCVEQLSAKRFFFIGTDGLRAHAIEAIVGDNVKGLGAEMVGSHYSLVGEYEFASAVKKIEKAKPSIILNMLVGDSIVAFSKALVDADITPRVLPELSFTLGENELAQLGNFSLAGNYIARTRFQPAPGDQEDSFAQRFKKKYGSHRPVSEVMEAAYYGVHLWAAAAEKAGSEDAGKVRLALKGQEFVLPGARVHVDPSTLHTWKLFQIGKITNDNGIEVIKTDEAPIPPIPFPPPRTRGEWDAFSQDLYKKWGENWANPQKPHTKKKSKRRSSDDG